MPIPGENLHLSVMQRVFYSLEAEAHQGEVKH